MYFNVHKTRTDIDSTFVFLPCMTEQKIHSVELPADRGCGRFAHRIPDVQSNILLVHISKSAYHCQ